MDQNNRHQPPVNRPAETPGGAPVQNGQEVPFFLQPEYQQPGSNATAPKGWSKTLVFAGVGIALLLVLGLVAIAISGRKATPTTNTTATTPQVALSKFTIDGVQFAYPKTWKEIETKTTGFTLGYGASADAAQNGVAIYYKKTQIIPSATKVSGMSAELKQNIQDAIVEGTKQKNTTAAGCKDFTLLSQKKLETSTYFGMDVSFECGGNSKGVAIRELDRYLYTGDGYLYQVAIVGLKSAWNGTAGELFTTMNQQVAPKAGS